ncbi:hypothetical protein SK128_005964 [Halocaridina rubra]|uniref:Reelin n=1 Tax=Halocaridina rubra TaxID=373956 RepID=A0AAN8ZTW7_HALRR
METDDLNAEEIEVLQFMLVIGKGGSSSCVPASKEEKLSAGSVVLEYSTDGGISWKLLQELLPSLYRNPRLFRTKLGEEVVKDPSGVVRFRIWQPFHNSQNQWAIDNLRITSDMQMGSMQADFAEGSSIMSPWMSVTANRLDKYCNSDDLAQILDGEEPVRIAVTYPLTLHDGDVISFQISVGCKSEGFGEEGLVLLEYSKDGGIRWSLVDEGCHSTAVHCDGPREPSIYRSGHHGTWTRFSITVDHKLSLGSIHLRWKQENPGGTRDGEFAMRDLYIGRPCPFACFGHGLCTAAGLCKCDEGYSVSLWGCSAAHRMTLSQSKRQNLEVRSHVDASDLLYIAKRNNGESASVYE